MLDAPGGPGLVFTPDPVEWDHPLNRGLVYWFAGVPPLDGGRQALDLCRPGFHLAGSGGSGWRGTPFGLAALDLNGTSAYAELIQTPPVTGVPLTIEAVVRPNAVAAAQAVAVLNVGTSSTANRYALLLSATGQVQAASGGQTASTTPTAAAGEWAHLCGVFAATNDRRAFLGGKDKATNTTTAAVTGTPDRMTVGARWASGALGAYLGGQVVSVRLYNRALADDEAAELAGHARRGYRDLFRRQPARVWLLGGASVNGSLAVTLGALTLSATGVAPVKGAAAVALADLTLAAAGAAPVGGQLVAALDAVTLSAAAVAPVKGSAAVTLDALTLSATGGAAGEVTGTGLRWAAAGGGRTWVASVMPNQLVRNDVVKAAGDTVRLAVDFGDLAELVGGANVASVSAGAVSPAGLTVSAWQADAGGYSASAVFSGGAAGTTYSVGVAVTLTTGAVVARTVLLKVV